MSYFDDPSKDLQQLRRGPGTPSPDILEEELEAMMARGFATSNAEELRALARYCVHHLNDVQLFERGMKEGTRHEETFRGRLEAALSKIEFILGADGFARAISAPRRLWEAHWRRVSEYEATLAPCGSCGRARTVNDPPESTACQCCMLLRFPTRNSPNCFFYSLHLRVACSWVIESRKAKESVLAE